MQTRIYRQSAIAEHTLLLNNLCNRIRYTQVINNTRHFILNFTGNQLKLTNASAITIRKNCLLINKAWLTTTITLGFRHTLNKSSTAESDHQSWNTWDFDLSKSEPCFYILIALPNIKNVVPLDSVGPRPATAASDRIYYIRHDSIPGKLTYR